MRLVEAQVNLRLAGGRKLGASIAREEYLVMLSNESTVASEWLEWLAQTAAANRERAQSWILRLRHPTVATRAARET